MFSDFTLENDPFSLFRTWLADAERSEPNDPNAMALATVDETGLPDVRVVLLKGHDEHGFVFYTNETSAKGRELGKTPKAALNFHWKSLTRQVRVRGTVEAVSEAESDAYYQSRARISRIGAWASKQSQALESRAVFEQAVVDVERQYGEGPIPRPPHWRGFRVRPLAIEFWHDRPFRLHDRIVFRRATPDNAWTKQRLYP